MLHSFQQTCLSEVRGPLVDLGVSEYGILSAITTLSDTQNNLGLNRQQSTSPSKPRYSVDDITLFRQIALDLREFRHSLYIVFLYVAPCVAETNKSNALHLKWSMPTERSFPTHRSLMGESPEAIEGQAKLFRVLIACAKYNPKVGYTQGNGTND